MKARTRLDPEDQAVIRARLGTADQSDLSHHAEQGRHAIIARMLWFRRKTPPDRGKGDDRNRTGVDGFAVRRNTLLSAYLSGFRRRQVLSGALKNACAGRVLGEWRDGRSVL
jgi:hypothetical protein